MLTHAKAITFVLTPDHKRAAAWYRDVLGLTHVSTDDFAAVFDLAGTTLRLTTVGGWQAGAHTVLGWAVPDMLRLVFEKQRRVVARSLSSRMATSSKSMSKPVACISTFRMRKCSDVSPNGVRRSSHRPAVMPSFSTITSRVPIPVPTSTS